MLNTYIENVKISGISVVIPTKELTLTDDKTLYNGDQKRLNKVIKSSGFLKRRIVDENTTSSDLCYQAAKTLIEEMNIDKSTIDGIIFVTQTPDYHIPATACILQDRLGLKQASIAFDVNQGCAGYTYGLYIASSLISKNVKKLLLLVGDTSSKYTDMFKCGNSAPIFGDAGSATLIEYDTTSNKMYFDIGTDGSEFDAIISRNGGFRNIVKKDDFYDDKSYKYDASMDGTRVMEFTLDKVPDSINNVLSYAKKTKDEIDYFILHQANKFIIENIVYNCDLDIDKTPLETLSKYGNQSCTSIPCAIADQIKSDVGTKNLTLLLSGFGIGLSWVSTIVNTQKIYCSGIREYKLQ